jgi:hypothetical protein
MAREARMGAGRLLAAALLAFAPAAAFASDGAIELGDACAKTTGCLAGDAAGYPITIAAPGNFVLTSDLDVPAATFAILLDANDVTIDLAGHWIRGPYTCGLLGCSQSAGGGIVRTASNGDRAVVRGGGVRGFGSDGIQLGTNSRVEKMNLHTLGRHAISLDLQGLAFENSVQQIGGTGLLLGLGSVYRDNAIAILGRSVDGGRAIGPNSCADELCGTTGNKLFYATPGAFDGASADTACDPGFHMASQYELGREGIGAVEHDTTRGAMSGDQGNGPPLVDAWLRSGDGPSTVDNCSGWALASAASGGLIAPPLGPVAVAACTEPRPVWCVQD